MKYLVASIICFVLALLILLMMGCRDYKPFPEGGEITRPPRGYEIHCEQFPDSIFCEDE
jgi:hypothetical protein